MMYDMMCALPGLLLCDLKRLESNFNLTTPSPIWKKKLYILCIIDGNCMMYLIKYVYDDPNKLQQEDMHLLQL